HDFTVGGEKTRALVHGQRQSILADLSRTGAYRFRSDLPGQAQLGMTGVLEVARRGPPKRSVAVSTRSTITLATVLSGLPPLTFAGSPPGDTHRVMVVEQNGLVLLLKDGHLAPQPFADLRSVVSDNGEQGLLSIAFAPDYATSGLLYAYYDNRNGNIRVVELHRSSTNPDTIDSSRRRVLAITKTTADHNGGVVQVRAPRRPLHPARGARP